MALSEVGFVMHHCDCPELLYGPGWYRLWYGSIRLQRINQQLL